MNLRFANLFCRNGDRLAFVIALLLNALMCGITVRAAIVSSPLFDELAHLASGIALAQYSDPGHFRVNPPANKWLTALAEPCMPSLQVPPMIDSSYLSNSFRNEFSFGDSLMNQNREVIHQALVTARLFRVLTLLVGSVLLWISCSRFSIAMKLMVQAFWCTSPLILGQGWVVSADAPAGVAMCAIVWSSLQWIESRCWTNLLLSGAMWGIAIGTKFTFAPLYIAFVMIMTICCVVRDRRQQVGGQLNREGKSFLAKVVACFRPVVLGKATGSLFGRWFSHALIACLTLQTLYLFQKPFVPIGKHDFISREFRPFKTNHAVGWKSVVASTPSPFPKLFLEGIDQQLADMNAPRGAYLLGERIPGKLPWFFLVGFLIKEQPALLVGLVLGLAIGLFRWVRSLAGLVGMNAAERWNRSLEANDSRGFILFCCLTVVSIAALFAMQVNLVWNIRYLIPALPPLIIASAFFLTRTNSPGSTAVVQRVFATIIAILLVVDLPTKWHSPFSYASPIFGGSYRVPMALNDSNFDYGQDIFHVHGWIEAKKAAKLISNDELVCAILSGHGRVWNETERRIATLDDLNRAIDRALNRENKPRKLREQSVSSRWKPLIVSRGLAHAEPWAVRYSDWSSMGYSGPLLERFRELCLLEPVEWITPTIAVYDCSEQEPDNP